MSLERIGFVPLPPGDEAGFDHAGVHVPGRLVYVARLLCAADIAVGEPGVVCTFSTDGDPTQQGVTETEAGAHTLTVDPASHHVYVFCPESGGAAVCAPR